MDKHLIEEYYRQLLRQLGFTGPNFKGTPERVATMWEAFTNPPRIRLKTFPTDMKTGIVAIKDHECWSFCPHHLLPVRYTIKVGYLPKERRVLGLSKLARLCDRAMATMPLQEELGAQIVMPLVDSIDPLGAGIIIHGEHLCMQMRGVDSAHVSATTDFMCGLFLEDQKVREEFMLL